MSDSGNAGGAGGAGGVLEAGGLGNAGGPRMSVLVMAEQLRRQVPGGIGTYTQSLLEAVAKLSASGVDTPEVSVAASSTLAKRLAARPSDKDPAIADRAGTRPGLGYSSDLGMPVRSSRLPGRLLTLAWDTGLLRAPSGFDVVHATSFPAPRLAGGALAITIHDLAWRRVPDAFTASGARWHESALQRSLHRATHFVVPSPPVAEDLVAAGASAERISVVPEGSDHLPPPDIEGARDLLDRLGVGEPYLLSVGTIEPRKNLATLVSAYSMCRSRLPGPWPLVLVGPTGWGPRLDPSPGVVLAGRVDGNVLAGLYQGARLVAYVPVHEGFGLPVLEAMTAGAPVVATKVPSSGGAALEVDPYDTSAMADALVAAACDERLRAELVEAGHRRAASLTWEAAALAHLDIWRRIR